MGRTRSASLGVLAASVAAVLAGGGVAHGAENVALKALAVSSHLPCTLDSGPENAVDGAASNINTDKWCVRSGQPTLTLQLTGSLNGYTVSHVVVKHAGAGGETPAFNTRAFRLRVGTSPLSPSITVATVTGNTANETVHPVGLTHVSQVQLLVDVPTQNTNQATRIYEVEVWGTPSTLLGLATGNIVQLPITPTVPIQTCNNSLGLGLIAVAVNGTPVLCI
jgi:mannosyl-glycoprotein endo-beta-N-acetylglucosaminidase